MNLPPDKSKPQPNSYSERVKTNIKYDQRLKRNILEITLEKIDATADDVQNDDVQDDEDSRIIPGDDTVQLNYSHFTATENDDEAVPAVPATENDVEAALDNNNPENDAENATAEPVDR